MTWALISVLLAAGAGQDPPPRDKLRLGIDYRWWGRDLQFRGTARAQDTSVGTSPTGATLDVQWFPASYFVDDRGADVGITMRIDMAPQFIVTSDGRAGGVGSSVSEGASKFIGSVMQLRTGMMFRVPTRYAEPAVHAGFHAFEATMSASASDGTVRPAIPNVSMQGPRLGLSLRLLEFWRITFDIAAGATWLMGLGEISTARFFPGAKGSAFDAKIGLAFRTWRWLDVRLGVDVSVHALDLGNGATATDAFYGLSLGIVFKGIP
ncbi:MAG: hypothetical protein JNM17_37160 [Archangium sp.]|nr:hypothetical protein [Archangium sp.]